MILSRDKNTITEREYVSHNSRSADFDYKDFINSPGIKIVYLLSKDELVKYKQYISNDFYKFLELKSI